MKLNDLKIVELATVLAGPLTASFFSELGARVVKFENKRTHGDITRQWKTPFEKDQAAFSSYYAAANWHKEVRMVDLSLKADRSKVYEEVKSADVVIANFKPGSAKKLGMDFNSLQQYKKDLIYASINGYGKDNPKPAFDAVLQAESGLMSLNGEMERGPLKLPLAFVDLLAAHQLKQGILVALLERDENQSGVEVSVSLYDAAISTLSNQGSNYLMNSEVPKRMGSLHPNIAPYGEVFRSMDGKEIMLAVGNNQQFRNLLAILGLEKEISNTLYLENADRVKNRFAMQEMLQAAFEKIESDHFLTKAEIKEVPATMVKNLKEVFASENAQKLILEEDIDGYSTKRLRSAIFKIDR